MDIITKEATEIINMTNVLVDGVSIVKDGPIKFCFKKAAEYFTKRQVSRVVNKNIVDPINNQLLSTKEKVTEIKEKSDDFIYECGKKIEECRREIKFNLKKIFRGVTSKEEKLNLIKSIIGRDEKIENIIISINEKNIKLDFKDKLEIIEYAIKRGKKEISQSLIKDITENIKNKSKKLKKQRETIKTLGEKINKLKRRYEMKNKWYGKVISFFNKNYFNGVKADLQNTVVVLEDQKNINQQSIEKNTKKYLLAYKNNDKFNSDYFNSFKINTKEKSKTLELNKTISNLSNAIYEINDILLEKQNTINCLIL